MPEPEKSTDQLLCEHRFVRVAEVDEQRCAHCDLGYREYAEAEVRAALTRMGTW